MNRRSNSNCQMKSSLSNASHVIATFIRIEFPPTQPISFSRTNFNRLNYLEVCLDAPTRLGFDDSLQASISFFSIKRHSLNIVKKGWCERIHSDVSE